MVIINEWDTSETSTRNISNWFEEWTGAQKRKYWSITQLILIQCLFLRVPSTMPYIMWKNKVAVREVPKVSMFCEVSLQFPQLQVVLCFEARGLISLRDLMQMSEMRFLALWTGTGTSYKLQKEVIHTLFSSYIFKPSLDQTVIATLLHMWEICIANAHNCKAMSQTSYPALIPPHHTFGLFFRSNEMCKMSMMVLPFVDLQIFISL